MNRNRNSLVLLAIIGAITWCYPETVVKVDPSTIRNMGGYEEVQELFGIMPGNMDPRIKPYLREARLTGIRNIINWIPNPRSAGLGYRYPSWNIEKTPAFATAQESFEWFDEFILIEPVPLWRELLGELSYLDDSYGEVSVCLSGNPFLFDGRLERNPEAAKAHVSAWITAIKNSRPDGARSRLKYFQLANEPEQEKNWAGQFDEDQALASASYTRVFNFLYPHVVAGHPDVKMIANCVGHDAAFRLTNPSKPDVDWDHWVKYFIDNAADPGALEYFNSQTYSIPTLRNLAFTCMTQSYAEQKRGVRPRQVISETGSPQNYFNQFLYTADNIFMMLEHPDKYAVRTAYVASEHDNHAIFRIVDDKVVPQSPYWVLSALKHLRGRIVDYRREGSNLRVFASSPDDSALVVAVLNPFDRVEQLVLHTGIEQGDIKHIQVRKAVWNDAAGNAVYSEEQADRKASLRIELPPHALAVYEVRTNAPLPEPRRVYSREYYGSGTRADMSIPCEISIDLPVLPDSTSHALLRMAVYEQPQAGSLKFDLNGHSHEVDLATLPDRLVDTYHKMVGFIEIPVNPELLKMNNSLRLDPLPRHTLLFSSLVVTSLQP